MSVVSYVALFSLSPYLFLISPSFDALGGLCFVIVAFSGSNTMSIYSRLSLSRTPRDSMKHFEISVVRHIRFTELRKKQLIEQPPLTE